MARKQASMDGLNPNSNPNPNPNSDPNPNPNPNPNQASMDGLRQRRQLRDFEAAGHTYGQLRTKHALGDAERQLHVKADFAPSETASQLGRAKSVGNLNALRRPSASIALRCHGQLGVGLTGLASLA